MTSSSGWAMDEERKIKFGRIREEKQKLKEEMNLRRKQIDTANRLLVMDPILFKKLMVEPDDMDQIWDRIPMTRPEVERVREAFFTLKYLITGKDG